MKRTRGFTLLELMVVVAIVGILAAAAVPALRAVTQNAKVSSTSFDVQLRLAGLKTKALADQDTLLAVVVDAAGSVGANCLLGRARECATLFVLRNPTAAWTLAAFDPVNPATNAELVDTRILGKGIRLASEKKDAAAPLPFGALKAFATELTGTCGGRTCMAVRYSPSGRVSGEAVGAPAVVPRGLVFVIGSDEARNARGGEHRAVMVAFPSGIVKGFPL